MTPEEFDTSGWIERVAMVLAELAHAQEPYLEEYWRDNPRRHVIVDERDETPFPLDDVRDLYSQVRYAMVFGREAHYESLRDSRFCSPRYLIASTARVAVSWAGRDMVRGDTRSGRWTVLTGLPSARG